eukprot:767530-Hanusia_phi.AAC.15
MQGAMFITEDQHFRFPSDLTSNVHACVHLCFFTVARESPVCLSGLSLSVHLLLVFPMSSAPSPRVPYV